MLGRDGQAWPPMNENFFVWDSGPLTEGLDLKLFIETACHPKNTSENDSSTLTLHKSLCSGTHKKLRQGLRGKVYFGHVGRGKAGLNKAAEGGR